MKTFLSKIKRLFSQLRGLFPEALPVGVPQFNKLVDSLSANYTLPTLKRQDVEYVVATMIINSSTGKSYRSKASFVRALHVAAAKQVAADAFQRIQAAAQAARLAAQTPVATTSAPVVAHEPLQQGI